MGGSSVRGPVDHVLLFGGWDQGGGALLGPAHSPHQPGSGVWGRGLLGVGGGDGGSSVRGPVDHVPLLGGRGVIRPRPPHPSTRKWILGEGFWG